MCGGVAKSGSPPPMLITDTPRAARSRTFCETATVPDAAMAFARWASRSRDSAADALSIIDASADGKPPLQPVHGHLGRSRLLPYVAGLDERPRPDGWSLARPI